MASQDQKETLKIYPVASSQETARLRKKRNGNGKRNLTSVTAAQVVPRRLFPCTNRISFILHSAFFHAGSKALVEPTMSALISLVLVNDALPVISTAVAFALPHRPSKKALTAIARGSPVVFSGCPITANGANTLGGVSHMPNPVPMRHRAFTRSSRPTHGEISDG